MSIEEFARHRLGIELLPWQKEFAQAVERGERPIYVGGQKAARSTMRFVINEYQKRGGHDR